MLLVTTTGYLGQFDFCAIAEWATHWLFMPSGGIESPAGSCKWYKYDAEDRLYCVVCNAQLSLICQNTEYKTAHMMFFCWIGCYQIEYLQEQQS
ncbi:hypothetical protein [Escherichia coli]